MFGNLVYGKFSLKETFWKFGVLGVFFCALVTRIFKAFLMQALNGATITYYYTHYFSPLAMDGKILFLTIGYFVCFAALCLYSIMVLFGIWRSSAEYDKSIWLRHIARIMMFLMVYLGVKFVL